MWFSEETSEQHILLALKHFNLEEEPDILRNHINRAGREMIKGSTTVSGAEWRQLAPWGPGGRVSGRASSGWYICIKTQNG